MRRGTGENFVGKARPTGRTIHYAAIHPRRQADGVFWPLPINPKREIPKRASHRAIAETIANVKYSPLNEAGDIGERAARSHKTLRFAHYLFKEASLAFGRAKKSQDVLPLFWKDISERTHTRAAVFLFGRSLFLKLFPETTTAKRVGVPAVPEKNGGKIPSFFTHTLRASRGNSFLRFFSFAEALYSELFSPF